MWVSRGARDIPKQDNPEKMKRCEKKDKDKEASVQEKKTTTKYRIVMFFINFYGILD